MPATCTQLAWLRRRPVRLIQVTVAFLFEGAAHGGSGQHLGDQAAVAGQLGDRELEAACPQVEHGQIGVAQRIALAQHEAVLGQAPLHVLEHLPKALLAVDLESRDSSFVRGVAIGPEEADERHVHRAR